MYKQVSEFKTLKDLCDYYSWQPAHIKIAVECIKLGDDAIEVMANSFDAVLYDNLFRIVVGVENELTGATEVRPEIMALLEEKPIVTFKNLTDALSKNSDIGTIQNELPNFYAPTAKRLDAKIEWEKGNFDVNKSVKVIVDFYKDKVGGENKAIIGLYSFLSSPSFATAYNNFKESKSDFWN